MNVKEIVMVCMYNVHIALKHIASPTFEVTDNASYMYTWHFSYIVCIYVFMHLVVFSYCTE